jgi:hypothetical protein
MPADEARREEPVETEAKLRASARAFRQLERLEEIDGWRVVERRRVSLRDTYWDTPDRQLGQAGCTLRVREQDGGPQAELTFKGRPGDGAGASRSRTEITVVAPSGSGPEQWRRLPAARPVLDSLRRLGVTSGLAPDLVLLNPRRELVLRRHWGDTEATREATPDEAVLSLDEVRIEGRPYLRRYVEIELKRGSQAPLDELVEVVATRYGLPATYEGKVQSARAWLDGAATPGPQR